jgi:hypothetical protein
MRSAINDIDANDCYEEAIPRTLGRNSPSVSFSTATTMAPSLAIVRTVVGDYSVVWTLQHQLALTDTMSRYSSCVYPMIIQQQVSSAMRLCLEYT